MLTEIFNSLVVVSCVSGVTALALLCLKPLTMRVLGIRIQIYLWISVLVVLACPLKVENDVLLPDPVNRGINAFTVREIPLTSVFEDYSGVYVSESVETVERTECAAKIWLGVALMLFVKYVSEYFLMKKKLYGNSVFCGKTKKIRIRECDIVGAPVLFGVTKPTLFLPKDMNCPEYLECIIAHERVHMRQKDIFVKWFSVLVKCVHWFNPMIYVVAKQISNDCEVACDVEATKNMTEAEKRNYMHVLLEVSKCDVQFRRSYAVGLTAEGKCLKRRLCAVQNGEKSGPVMYIVGGMLMCLFTFGPIFIGGILNGNAKAEIEPGEYRMLVKGDTSTVSSEGGSVSEDKDESLIKEETTDIANSDENAVFSQTEKPKAEEMTEPEPEKTEEKGTSVSRKEPKTRGTFNSDDGDSKSIYGVTADENGCITIGIRSNMQETIDVYISDYVSGKEAPTEHRFKLFSTPWAYLPV